MDKDETLTTVLTLVVLLAVAVGGSYGAYKYGRTVERRVLYGALVGELELAYGDGFNEGLGKGRTKGWADAMKEVDSDSMFSGRY